MPNDDAESVSLRSEVQRLKAELALLRRSNDDVARLKNELAAVWSASHEFSIPFDELELGETVGGGGSAAVHRALWRGTLVAVKLWPQRGGGANDDGRSR